MKERREQFLASGRPDTEIERFMYALEFVRHRYPMMTLGALSTFLAVARVSPEGTTPTELGQTLGMPLPTIFRQCTQLSDGSPGKPGMGLLKKTGNDTDGRSRKVRVSLTGLHLSNEINDILRPS